MATPPTNDMEIRYRFDELINKGTVLIQKMEDHNREYHHRNRNSSFQVMGEMPGHTVEFNAFVVNSCNVIKKVFGHLDDGIKYQNRIENLRKGSGSVKTIVGILFGLKDDYESGFLERLRDNVNADISADYLTQAEALLKEGDAGQNDHVPAAVLCGAVLENRLRDWCDQQIPPISTTKSDGSNMTLGPLIEELRRTNTFEKQVLRQLQWWADIRNHAAHGEFDKFKRDHVALMIKGVEHFLVNELGR